MTGAVPGEDSAKLMKFHGVYVQDDRDLRDERRRQKLEPAYSFLIRLRLPGGVCTASQWLKLDEPARAYGNGSLRVTTADLPVPLGGKDRPQRHDTRPARWR